MNTLDKFRHWPWLWLLCSPRVSHTWTASEIPQWTCCKPHGPPKYRTHTDTNTHMGDMSHQWLQQCQVPVAKLLQPCHLKHIDRGHINTHVQTNDVHLTAQKALKTTFTKRWALVGLEVETEQSQWGLKLAENVKRDSVTGGDVSCWILIKQLRGSIQNKNKTSVYHNPTHTNSSGWQNIALCFWLMYWYNFCWVYDMLNELPKEKGKMKSLFNKGRQLMYCQEAKKDGNCQDGKREWLKMY